MKWRQKYARLVLAKAVALALGLASALTATSAGANEKQAAAFAKIYFGTCMQHVARLDALRQRLAPIPALPEKDAAKFLGTKKGKAWPVPDPDGTFVLAIPDGENFCALFLRRVDVDLAAAKFIDLVKAAPAPLASAMKLDEGRQDPVNGAMRTIAYEWGVDKAPIAMQFMLTTASSESAPIQAVATATFGRREPSPPNDLTHKKAD